MMLLRPETINLPPQIEKQQTETLILKLEKISRKVGKH